MAVVSTKGLKIWMSKAAASPTVLVPTAISDALHPVITVASTTGILQGDLVTFANTGFAELDGKTLVVDSVTATTFTVIGADTTNSTGVLGATPEARHYEADDLCPLCLSAIDIAAGTINPISVATFCDPTASVPGNPTAGTVSFTGYVDVSDPCYPELLKAADDGLPRVIKIDLPGGNGYLVGTVIIGAASYAIPLEGAVAYTFTGTQSSKITHVFP